MKKKFLLFALAFVVFYTSCVFATTYDIANATSAKKMSDYNSTTTIDQMDTVLFGSYPQNDMTGVVKEPIEWFVVAIQDDKLYLLSKKILDIQSIGTTNWTKNYGDTKLHEWLNSYFLNNAFNIAEQTLLVNTEWILESFPVVNNCYWPDYNDRKDLGVCTAKVSIPSTRNLGYCVGHTITVGDDYRLESKPTAFAFANIKKIKDPNNGEVADYERLAHSYWTRSNNGEKNLWYYDYWGPSSSCFGAYFAFNRYRGVRPYIVVSLKGEN